MPTVSAPRCLTASSAAIPANDPVLEPPLKQATRPFASIERSRGTVAVPIRGDGAPL